MTNCRIIVLDNDKDYVSVDMDGFGYFNDGVGESLYSDLCLLEELNYDGVQDILKKINSKSYQLPRPIIEEYNGFDSRHILSNYKGNDFIYVINVTNDNKVLNNFEFKNDTLPPKSFTIYSNNNFVVNLPIGKDVEASNVTNLYVDALQDNEENNDKQVLVEFEKWLVREMEVCMCIEEQCQNLSISNENSTELKVYDRVYNKLMLLMRKGKYGNQ